MPDVIVRLSVSRIDVADLRCRGELVLNIEDVSAVVFERACAWAAVRGFDRLAAAWENIFSGEPPESGFLVVINKPHGVLLMVTWPWAPDPA